MHLFLAAGFALGASIDEIVNGNVLGGVAPFAGIDFDCPPVPVVHTVFVTETLETTKTDIVTRYILVEETKTETVSRNGGTVSETHSVDATDVFLKEETKQVLFVESQDNTIYNVAAVWGGTTETVTVYGETVIVMSSRQKTEYATTEYYYSTETEVVFDTTTTETNSDTVTFVHSLSFLLPIR
ncbi:MAG: uncharacterized protein A8A55_1205 [Amphiamblys sp. WSBS2006]|nr:MAG: uncharacterized protein A8A55_1205 [Amphiamblys sp. WSBS2006]